MPADIEKINRDKEKIISLIKLKGPSLPVQIARAIEQPPLFTSAFLSELVRENRLKLSSMKVGSSALYFIQGQEALLENFTEHLNGREREAVFLLKDKKVLSDDEQTPVLRVALRAVKDFAIPIKVRINEQPKLFWKYFVVPEEEFKSLLHRSLAPPNIQTKSSQEVQKPLQLPKIQKSEEKSEAKGQLEQEAKQEKPKNKSKTKEESKFISNIKEYLASRDIEILETILEKKKDFVSKIRIDTPLGKQEFYLVAKDKKKVNQDDLTIALQKAQTEKMPALFFSSGELDKKSIDYAKSWKNLIKFEKLKF